MHEWFQVGKSQDLRWLQSGGWTHEWPGWRQGALRRASVLHQFRNDGGVREAGGGRDREKVVDLRYKWFRKKSSLFGGSLQ